MPTWVSWAFVYRSFRVRGYALVVPETLSAVVISYNRADIVGTCLRALGFADEVIVVDKSSTDATPEIAARNADRVVTVPWTPTVEDTRAFAVAQCSGDWILCLDDDECLNPCGGNAIRAELAAPRADIYYLPRLEYILGVHDEAAYYWPEHHPRLFRHGALTFATTVHGGIGLGSDRILHLPPESGVVLHHLSHRNVAEWIGKCNRYTSRPDRRRVKHAGRDLVAFAHARIEYWLGQTRDATPGGYPAAAAVLRSVYDIVDRLKIWEEERGLNGAAAFARICTGLDAAYAGEPGANLRAAVLTTGQLGVTASDDDAERAALRARIAELRESCDGHATNAARLDAELVTTRRRLESTEQALAVAQRRIEAVETSTCWRATAGVRRLGEQAKRLAGRR